MKHYLYLLLLFTTGLYAQNENEIILKMVNETMYSRLQLIPIGSEKKYGFDDRASLSECTAGIPIRVLQFADNNTTVVFKEEWRIPIVFHNEYRSLFTVQKIDGNYEVVDMGGAPLAREIQKREAQLGKIAFMLRDYNLKIDFVASEFSVNNTSTKYFTPLLFSVAEQQYKNTMDTKTPLTITDIINLRRN